MPTELNYETARFAPGFMSVVADGHAVRQIYFTATMADARQRIDRDYPFARHCRGPVTAMALQQLGEYFAGRRWHFDLPLSTQRLSRFSRRVHDVLCGVPPGVTVSYAELGVMAGSPGSARAVGRVMASNPYPIVVPCHRVVCSGGKLGEYSAAEGAATKSWLLAFERQHAVADTL